MADNPREVTMLGNMDYDVESLYDDEYRTFAVHSVRPPPRRRCDDSLPSLCFRGGIFLIVVGIFLVVVGICGLTGAFDGGATTPTTA
ncbi:Uu.00g015880.m01.CDS01 [Anthostomella pinea]|uniref:Uu.00g015880.m01.CDS01 n=1 Tax=Anthostomella pinea TaxID=933095 RepID=A0AAI8VZ92_9PEZI|nr:Uu.00g015880.m01.CDS01 [Anthostomella pinea]